MWSVSMGIIKILDVLEAAGERKERESMQNTGLGLNHKACI